jgi:ribonuclease VapC
LALILGEPGGERVQDVLTDCAMTAVNLGEVVGHFARIGSPEADIRLMLDPLPFVRVALDEELAFIAGLMLPATGQAGLSFGDRAYLALANKLGVQALTADRAWQRIGRVVGVEIELIRGGPH